MGKDADRDREDRELFKRLKIVFRGRSPEWPLHHLKTCQKISILGSQRYSTYCSDEDGSKFWREETKSHAQQLVDTVCRLTRNQSSEMQWRLDIEKIVFKRLEFEIKWYVILIVGIYGFAKNFEVLNLTVETVFGDQKLRQSRRLRMSSLGR
jgi:hypothetical protein